MKIVICTTPIRTLPTNYPPFGSMALIRSLRDAGYDPYFYDIDGLRPDFDEVRRFFRDHAPDMVGISAVVSTAYSYTKELAQAIREACPEANIVVGGNLAASAEILLRFCEVDVCGIGEGEKVIVNLAKYWEVDKVSSDLSQLKLIKGISYLEANEVVFTGYEAPIPATDFPTPDWPILEEFSNIENFLTDPLTVVEFMRDPRSHEPHRKGKKLATAITAKGCVARCTFCHRWDKGYRHHEVDGIIDNIKFLIDRYDVGFINFSDENFGSDRKKTDELIERLRPLDILYEVGGVRCRSVDPELLGRLKESGCVALFYGMETGSARILDVMEKNTSLEQNLNAAMWTHQAGLFTIYQLILGMPGEDHQTIEETGKFIQTVTEFLPDTPQYRLSINYIQALPGTPVYEYARSIGAIGKSLEEEEEYLIRISDIDAVDDSRFLNFTRFDYMTVQSWRQKIFFDAQLNWYKYRSWKPAPKEPEIEKLHAGSSINKRSYFNLGRSLVRHSVFYRLLSFPLAWPLRRMYPLSYILVKDFKNMPKKQFLSYVGEHLHRKLFKRPGSRDLKSLRIVMKDRTAPPSSLSEESMLPMREGR